MTPAYVRSFLYVVCSFDFELLFNKDFPACWNTVDGKLLKGCDVLIACARVCSVGLGLVFHLLT